MTVVPLDGDAWQIRAHERGGWTVPDDNLFDLMPDESRTVVVSWRAAEVPDRLLRLSGFDLGARRVR
ncbi:MAG TPA: hypothetical protein VFZ32_02315 [Micromonosporaceae bacterium]